jgi:chaperonin cofactor prefoldin
LCVRHNKSVSGDRLDESFKELLKVVYPKSGAIQLAKTVLLDLWEKRVQTLGDQQVRLEKRITEIKKQVDVLSERVVRAMDEKLAHVYEDQIIKCQRESEELQEKLRTLGVSSVSFETALEVVFGFLKNPVVIWETEDINAKRLVLKLVFAEKLAYHPDLGFETAQKSKFVGLFETISANDSQDVEMGRIELPCNGGSGELLRSVVYFSVLSSIRLKQTKSNEAADLFFIKCIDQLQSLEPTI